MAEWKRLTHEDIEELLELYAEDGVGFYDLLYAVETKLQDLNECKQSEQ